MTSKRNEDNWAELDSLVALFEDTLKVTTKARNVLTISNQETLKLLTNWEIPEFPYEEPVCTCNFTPSKREEDLSRIVRNVEQAVVNAQRIREKSYPQQRLKVKQEDKAPTVSCNPYLNAELKKDADKTSLVSKLGSTTQDNTLSKSRSTSKLAPQKSSENTARRLTSKFSKVQTTYQKDFLVPSKMPRFRQQSVSPRLCSKKEISAQDSYKLNEIESSSKQIPLQNARIFSPAQRPTVVLNHNESKKSNSISMDQTSEQHIVNTCPVHGNGKLAQKQSSCVNLAEAIDVLGVPPEMVKYLRSYHSFVTHFQCEDKPIRMNKGRKVAEKFLGQLAEVVAHLAGWMPFLPNLQAHYQNRIMASLSVLENCIGRRMGGMRAEGQMKGKVNCPNGWQWKDMEEEPLGAIFQECVPLFTEVFGTKELGCEIEDRIKILDKKCQKWFNLYESVDPVGYSGVQNTISPLQDNLLINGIWNFKNKRRSKVFQYIRYSSPVQWKKLFKNIQDIQRVDLQLQVFTELEGIVPLLEMCSPDDPSFMLLFKAICTICDITKLSLPVIFRS